MAEDGPERDAPSEGKPIRVSPVEDRASESRTDPVQPRAGPPADLMKALTSPDGMLGAFGPLVEGFLADTQRQQAEFERRLKVLEEKLDAIAEGVGVVNENLGGLILHVMKVPLP